MRAEYLRALARETLETLVLERAETDEGFAFWLDGRLAAAPSGEAGAPLASESVRRRAEELLPSARPGYDRRPWGEGTSGVDEASLEELIGLAEPALAAGRGADALAVLKPVAEALADHWPECAHWDETLHEFFPVLDRMIAQAVLMEGVSREAREALTDELDAWRDEPAEYGADDAFSTAIAACMRGWEEPGLEDALAGHGQDWPPGGRDERLEDDLTRARLMALEGMKRTEAYLHLSRAAGLHAEHAVKLARLGRVDEAIATGRRCLAKPGDILRLVHAVATADRMDAALDLAAWGVSLPARDEGGDDWPHEAGRLLLARWLREAAREAGRRDTMLMAARVAFEESLAREDFRAASKLAGSKDWPALRETLLAALLAARHAFERIEILLDENMIDEAVARVDPREARFNPCDGRLERLAERAYADHPDWAIELAFRMADPIMNEGRSGHYETAAGWLAIAARAHVASGRAGEWVARLESLIETHRRKYKLRPLLEALRHAAC